MSNASKFRALFERMSDVASSVGYTLEGINTRDDHGYYLLHQGTSKVRFYMKLEGDTLTIYEGVSHKSGVEDALPPIIMVNATALMVLGVLLRFKLYKGQ
jgi:hypothetical protein